MDSLHFCRGLPPPGTPCLIHRGRGRWGGMLALWIGGHARAACMHARRERAGWWAGRAVGADGGTNNLCDRPVCLSDRPDGPSDRAACLAGLPVIADGGTSGSAGRPCEVAGRSRALCGRAAQVAGGMGRWWQCAGGVTGHRRGGEALMR